MYTKHSCTFLTKLIYTKIKIYSLTLKYTYTYKYTSEYFYIYIYIYVDILGGIARILKLDVKKKTKTLFYLIY